MNQEFKNCLKRGQITKESGAKKFATKEIREAERDLQNAKDSLTKGDAKWATVQSYYAGFHAVRALLYNRGYKERSHYCLLKAIRALFVEEGLLEARLIKLLEKIKGLREKADYESEYSQQGAEIALHGAKELVQKAEELIP